MSKINIFTTLNDAYYPRLRVFAHTLRKHTKGIINLKILHFSLSQKRITEFKKIARKLEINVEFIMLRREAFDRFVLVHHITSEAYTKLVVLEVYPAEDRAIWIDVDTVVLKDVEDFYNETIDDYYVLGTPEKKEKLDIARLKLGENATYFNAGVVLFNLRRIREEFSTQTLINICENNQHTLRFADQDVMNLAFAANVKRDETEKYNYMIRSGHVLCKAEKKAIKENVVIVHYIRHIKPWHYYFQGNARFLYLKEMFPIYPVRTVFLLIVGELYKLKPTKRTLENTTK